MVVVVQVLRQALITIGSARVFLEIDFLVFHRSPQSLDHHVVDRPPFAVHADCHILAAQQRRELAAGELASLVRVEDLRLSLPKRILQRFDAESTSKLLDSRQLIT